MRVLSRAAATIAAGVMVLGGVAAAEVAGAADEWEPSAGGWSAGPVEHVASLPFEPGPAGGLVRQGDLLVATTWSSFSLYDIADPLAPHPLSVTPLGLHLINERPQIGDGWLAVNSDIDQTLSIYDITDPTAPDRIGSLEYAGYNHQWTCVQDCEVLYSNNGLIVSMTDPSNLEVVGDWNDSLPEEPRDTHGIAEVAPAW